MNKKHDNQSITYFIDPEGQIWGFDEGADLTQYYEQGWTEITIEEARRLLQEKRDADFLALPDEEKIHQWRNQVEDYIDEQAQYLGFKSALVAVTYADEPTDPSSQAHGKAIRQWRSKCWVKFLEIMETWQQKGGEEPTYESIIANLPKLEDISPTLPESEDSNITSSKPQMGEEQTKLDLGDVNTT